MGATKRALIFLLLGLSALAGASPASAAPTQYALQLHGARPAPFSLNGDEVSGLDITVAPQTCANGDPRNSSDSVWRITIGPADGVRLTNGRFVAQGMAPSAYYPGGAASFTVNGTVSPDHRVVTGTISLADGHDPFLAGCSATYAFLAVPKPTSTPAWGAPRNRDFTSQFLSFNYRGGVVSHLVVQANFHCGTGPDPSVDEAEIDAAAYGEPAIHTTRTGQWSLHTYILDEYGMILRLDLTAVTGSRVTHGHIQISEPTGLVGVAGLACSGSYNWSAARPTPPAPPGPTAFFNWEAVRIPVGAAYRYYFYVSGLSCANRATAVDLTVAGRTTRVGCGSRQGWASRPLAPGRSYTTTARAVRVRRGRVIQRGVAVTEPIRMPGAGDYWHPISRLPGTPPA